VNPKKKYEMFGNRPRETETRWDANRAKSTIVGVGSSKFLELEKELS
jgi:hypothetical protein